MIPDTIQGAIMLSLIDFTLSIVMITAIGFVLWALPLLNQLGKVDEQMLRKARH